MIAINPQYQHLFHNSVHLPPFSFTFPHTSQLPSFHRFSKPSPPLLNSSQSNSFTHHISSSPITHSLILPESNCSLSDDLLFALSQSIHLDHQPTNSFDAQPEVAQSILHILEPHSHEHIPISLFDDAHRELHSFLPHFSILCDQHQLNAEHIPIVLSFIVEEKLFILTVGNAYDNVFKHSQQLLYHIQLPFKDPFSKEWLYLWVLSP